MWVNRLKSNDLMSVVRMSAKKHETKEDETVDVDRTEEKQPEDELETKDLDGESIDEEPDEKEEEKLTKEELEEEIDDLESSLKKVMADFDNYKKRMVKEKKKIRELATEDLMIDLLEIVDDFERALENEDEIDKDGIEMIFNKLVNTLKDHGLKKIEAQKKQFDPMYHECIQSEDCEDVEKNQIIEVFQKGYMLNGKVIRPSKVKVAK